MATFQQFLEVIILYMYSLRSPLRPFLHISQTQNCIPDVIIWMLSGNKRVACKRIPSHLLMYSTLGKARGKLCGKVQTIFLTVRNVNRVSYKVVPSDFSSFPTISQPLPKNPVRILNRCQY